jgi:hypothetical protein
LTDLSSLGLHTAALGQLSESEREQECPRTQQRSPRQRSSSDETALSSQTRVPSGRLSSCSAIQPARKRSVWSGTPALSIGSNEEAARPIGLPASIQRLPLAIFLFRPVNECVIIPRDWADHANTI